MIDLEDLHTRLRTVVKELSKDGRHLKFAIRLSQGEKAYEAYNAETPGKRTEKSATEAACTLRKKNPLIDEYGSLVAQIAAGNALIELQYDEKQWLADTLTALDMALGRREIASINFEGAPITYKKTNLGAAAKIAEQLGKKLGIFKEQLAVNVKAAVVPIDPDMDPKKAAEAYQEMMRLG